MNILHLDTNHPLLIQQLIDLGFINDEDYTSLKEQIESKISAYQGVIVRSRFTIDKHFLDAATSLKFIGRVGAGLENIDCVYALKKGIELIAAPEGNRNAVGEHTLGMILSLFNKPNKADREVREGKWLRETNRGIELDGKTVGLIGYGNMGKAFAKKLRGFEVTVICYDIKPNVDDKNCKQVSLEELRAKADVVSLHTPQTPLTLGMVNTKFINQFKKPFWFLNTARGKSVRHGGEQKARDHRRGKTPDQLVDVPVDGPERRRQSHRAGQDADPKCHRQRGIKRRAEKQQPKSVGEQRRSGERADPSGRRRHQAPRSRAPAPASAP
jgi:D-3-phosphoglycerate dehydrogenase